MPLRNARFVLPALVATGALVLSGCSAPQTDDAASPDASAPSVAVRDIEPHAVLLDSADPAELALTASQTVYSRAETVVLADADDEEARGALAAAAVAVRAPALLARGGTSDGGLGEELQRLGARAAVVVGEEDGVAAEAAEAAGVQVVHLEADVVTTPPEPDQADPEDDQPEYPELEEDDLADLVGDLEDVLGTPVAAGADDGSGEGMLREVLAVVDPQPGQEAAIASLRAAGAVPADVPGGDLGALSAVSTLDEAQALTVVGVGASFGDPEEFGWRVAAAERAALLPTGSQHLLPARYVTTSASVWDDPESVVARAQEAAAAYGEVPDATDESAGGTTDDASDDASDDTTGDTTDDAGDDEQEPPTTSEGELVVPTLVVTASASSGSPGEDGDWVDEEELDTLRPLVAAARDEGVYVLLDIGAGAAPLVEEVRHVEPLLRAGGVGVSVHPEGRIGDGVQTTSHEVPVAEVQDVVDHLAGVVTGEGLPPAMLVVHQTRPESVVDRAELRPVPQVETVVLADRTGGPTTGEWVWGQVSIGLPDGVHAGWSGPAAPYPGVAGTVPSEPAPVLVAAS
ncbi:hypothetical protein [Isoptericola cucumis]|uniref:hypothetical protein n=1 Tax=Isoptericola cucumis TaxID=1776856 RepID=UPI0016645003|nr:hypothetical protein [Isoptericola cucumis]